MEKQQTISIDLDPLTKWVFPMAFCFVTLALRWTMTDVCTDSYIWDKDRDALISKLKALIISMAGSFISFYLCKYNICHYANRPNRIKEYLPILLFFFVVLNFANWFANVVVDKKESYNLTSFIRTNSIMLPMSMVGYFYLRSKIFNIYYTQQSLQIEKIRSQQYSTELDYLKAQYHPHFLFNALNTVYFKINEENTKAKHSVELLSSLLRYQIYDIKSQVTLEQEIEHLENFIEFQKMRKDEFLSISISIDAPMQDVLLHPLLFQPLVENALISSRGKNMNISCSISQTSNMIKFSVQNTINPSQQDLCESSDVGMENLKRRLELLYPQLHELEFEHTPELFIATLTINTKH